ncbi:MAG: PIN domain-containing protein [Micromonosporaceae bacterium]|nr:PIN domain-containing protein [Micromonosporaceae bacterium]
MYDAGALVAADRGDRRVWAEFATAVAQRRPIIVPSPVLTQAWRGWRTQARLARLLGGCRVLPPEESVAKQAGELLGLSKTTDAVDAIVVATAIALRAVIVTSDLPDMTRDMTRLVDSAQTEFEIAITRV